MLPYMFIVLLTHSSKSVIVNSTIQTLRTTIKITKIISEPTKNKISQEKSCNIV